MRAIRTLAALHLALGLLAGPVLAQDVPVERNVLNGTQVTLHVYPFLTADELATFRFAMTNEQGLALLLPESGEGYAAIALAPQEGMIRDGKLSASVSALKGFADAATAVKENLAACEAKRDPAGQACVIVLEVAPKG